WMATTATASTKEITPSPLDYSCDHWWHTRSLLRHLWHRGSLCTTNPSGRTANTSRRSCNSHRYADPSANRYANTVTEPNGNAKANSEANCLGSQTDAQTNTEALTDA